MIETCASRPTPGMFQFWRFHSLWKWPGCDSIQCLLAEWQACLIFQGCPVKLLSEQSLGNWERVTAVWLGRQCLIVRRKQMTVNGTGGYAKRKEKARDLVLWGHLSVYFCCYGLDWCRISCGECKPEKISPGFRCRTCSLEWPFFSKWLTGFTWAYKVARTCDLFQGIITFKVIPQHLKLQALFISNFAVVS